LYNFPRQPRLKFGPEFFEHAIANEHGCVNERVVHKLSVQPPSAHLATQYLQQIAKE
jgi:vacuolar protein sorting-associated protein IST1